MRCRLQYASADLASRLIDSPDQDEKAVLRHMCELTRRIENLMPKFVPRSDTTSGPTRTMLCHDSLSLDNILIDRNGLFGGVLDWQCISCRPLHEACQFPAFLQQAFDRFREPAGRFYLIDADGPPHPAYYRDYKRYEMTQLRQLYIGEMLDRVPDFVDIWEDEASANLRDYEAAVQNCDNEFTADLVEKWVEAMEDGEDPARVPKRLHELLME
ncbi:hypothetical protein O1611_g7703 [Lasiodiplodia mahajangana]|uniref:Uncharacterized protein n=1 Tax=Lasiodiplodia mahajangana TaxID=1108764 RepID=A0ACC2JES2_9PEZI|nr:hypothetical protein O1611_g7703 [Lasiodiplodia mahajangana]